MPIWGPVITHLKAHLTPFLGPVWGPVWTHLGLPSWDLGGCCGQKWLGPSWAAQSGPSLEPSMGPIWGPHGHVTWVKCQRHVFSKARCLKRGMQLLAMGARGW